MNGPRTARRIAHAPASSFRKLKPVELVKLGYSPKSERYVETSHKRLVAGKTQTISKRQLIVKREGVGPERLAAERKANPLAYKSAATREQANAQRAWRARTKRKKSFAKEAFAHAFIDRDGRERRELFSGRSLAIMQEYRRDWNRTLRMNDDAILKRYDRLNIVAVSGERVHPATKLETIRNAEARMTPRQRNRFEADVHYHSGDADAMAA
jgi:hypothetical protein